MWHIALLGNFCFQFWPRTKCLEQKRNILQVFIRDILLSAFRKIFSVERIQIAVSNRLEEPVDPGMNTCTNRVKEN